jgi:hypothetical protein
MAVDHSSYAMEVLGGNGYVEEFVTSRLLRDAQVLPIWEGTSNVLSLELLRVLDREDAAEPFLPAVQERLDAADGPGLSDAVATVESEFADLQGAMMTLATGDPDYAQLQAKELADYVFDVFAAAELLASAREAIEDGDGRLAVLAREFVADAFERTEARGIGDGDRRPLERFDAIVRHATVGPESLVETPARL